MLRTQGLTYAIANRKLINEITLDFSSGLLYGILGPNGSGKSTFLKTLTGIWTPAAGDVLWRDQKLHRLPRREISKILSLVPQQYPLVFDCKVFDLVAMGRYSYNDAHTKSGKIIIERSLKQVDAWHLRERLATQVSHGERQRIFIARALTTESPVLLLDEPTANIDIRHKLEIWDLMRLLVNKGKTVLVTLHDLEAAQSRCDRVAVFNEGHCIAQGLPNQVLNDTVLKEVFGVYRKEPHLPFTLYHAAAQLISP